MKGSKSLVTLLPLPPLPPLPGFLGQRQSDQKLQIWAVSSNHDTNTNISSPKIALTTKAISSLKKIQFMVVHTIYIVEASYNEPQPSPSRKDFIPSHLVTIQKNVTYSSFPEILATSNLSSPKTRQRCCRGTPSWSTRSHGARPSWQPCCSSTGFGALWGPGAPLFQTELISLPTKTRNNRAVSIKGS